MPFSKVLYIEQDDFREDPPKQYYRLSPGREVRLRYGYFITAKSVVKNDKGEVVEVHCTYDPATRGGNAPDGRKVKSTIHWVSAAHAIDAEVRIYDKLFTKEDPNQVEEGQEFTANLNPNSLEVIAQAKLEPSLANAPVEGRYQFERLGYFCVDPDSKPGQSRVQPHRGAERYLGQGREEDREKIWSVETRLAASPLQSDIPSLPRPARVHHPEIRVRRLDHAKRHPEITSLSPTVAPAVLHKSQLFRQVVAETKHFVAALLLFARFRNRHDAGVRHLLRHKRLVDRKPDCNRPRRRIGQAPQKVRQTSDAVISACLVLERVLRLLRRRRRQLARDVRIERRFAATFLPSAPGNRCAASRPHHSEKNHSAISSST